MLTYCPRDEDIVWIGVGDGVHCCRDRRVERSRDRERSGEVLEDVVLLESLLAELGIDERWKAS